MADELRDERRPIRVVALNGSERYEGSTALLLRRARDYVARRGADMEVIALAAHRIDLCRCGRCNSRPDPCPVDDDVSTIVARMARADAIVYAAPVHGFGMAAVMQAFIERAGVGYLRFSRPLTNKVGGVIVVGRRYSHEAVHAQLLNNLLLNRMIVAGSGFPAVVHAGGPGVVDMDSEGLDSMYRMLDRMVDLTFVLRDPPNPLGEPAAVELRSGVLA